MQKKITRTIIAFLLSISLLSSAAMATTSGTASTRFVDTESTWYKTAVVEAETDGLLDIYTGTTLNGSAPALASELSRMICLEAGIWTREPDMRETWQVPYLEKAGLSEDHALTRNDAALMIFDLLGLTPSTSVSPYTDVSDARLTALKECGIMSGMLVDGKLRFNGSLPLSRAQMIVLSINVKQYSASHQKETTAPSVSTAKEPYYLYAGIDSVPEGWIDPNTPLPEEPRTEAEFRQVYDYMAIHGLTELSIPYEGVRSESFLTETKETLTKVHNQYRYEHTELYNYLTHLSYTCRSEKDSFSLRLTLDGPISSSTALGYRRASFQKAAEVVDSLYASGVLSKTMSERTRAKLMLDWLLDHVEYKNQDQYLDHTAWSVFFRGSGVCDGITSAYNLLLSYDGIQCWGQRGYYLESNELHQWTVAYLDGNLLNIDATFGVGQPGIFRYQFFAVTDDVLKETHFWQS